MSGTLKVSLKTRQVGDFLSPQGVFLSFCFPFFFVGFFLEAALKSLKIKDPRSKLPLYNDYLWSHFGASS